MAFVLGVSSSDIALVLVSNVFTELFKSISNFKTEIGVAGCAFLISLGIYFLFFKKVKVDEAGKQVFKFRKRDYAKMFISGFFMNTLNPGVFAFWIMASTTVITNTIQERIVTFLVCLVLVFSADTAKVFLAGKIRTRLTPHNIHILNKVNGGILVVSGIALIWGLVVFGERI